MSKKRKKKPVRRDISPFSKVKHLHRMVENSRSTNGLYAYFTCQATSTCKRVQTVLLEEG